MPETMSEHSDLLWFIIIGLIALLGTAASIISALFSRANKAEMGMVKIEIKNVKDGQKELKQSMTRVHERIDESNKEVSRVDGKVNKLEGRADTMEKLFNGKVKVAT